MARLSSELVLSLTDRVSGPARAIDRNLDNLERRQGRFGRTSRLAAEDAAGMGRAQSLILAGVASVLPPVAVAATGQSIIAAAADFESALTNIQKKSGATAEQTAKLGEEIKALATSGKLAVPIEEIAAAYERGAAAGIPLGDLRKFAALSAKAADAFEMSATDVGNAAAGFNKVLGVPMTEMQRYFDLINGLADAGIADESGIIDYIDQGGAMAKTFGFTAQETAALGAALANLKVSASKGATATNSILTKLLAPDALSGDARQAYNALIKDDKRFRKQLADGKAAEAFVEIIDSLKAMDKERRTGIIAELFGQDHLDVMTQLVEGSEEVKTNFRFAAGQSWFDSLDKSYALKLNDFWSQWQLFRNEIQKAMIDVGAMGLPGLSQGLQSARSLIGEIRAGVDQMAIDLDWQSIDRAGQAIGDLKATMADFLGMDTNGSLVADFFRDLTKLVNEVAAGVEFIKAQTSIAGESALGQVIAGDEDERREGAQRLGTEIDPATGRLKPVPFKPGGLVPGLTGLLGEQTGAGSLEGSQAERDRTERVGRSPSRQVADRFGDPLAPMDAATLDAQRQRRSSPPNATVEAAVPVPTPRPASAAMQIVQAQLPAAPPAVPIPTPRPDIVGPVTAEGEAAAARATEIGLRISEAFSVTGRPIVDTSGIDAALTKAMALRRELSAIPAAARAASDATASARADYSGLHADIEE